MTMTMKKMTMKKMTKSKKTVTMKMRITPLTARSGVAKWQS